MAGGIDWFRWHHGSVSDPKFQLVAKKAGARLGDVVTVWAFVLEKASANPDRGTIGPIDFETLDFLLGAEDGTAARILDAMTTRGLICDERVVRWEDRQAKREREDDTAAERKRRQREREAAGSQGQQDTATEGGVTPCHATSHQRPPREEESREEERISPSLRSGESAGKPRAARQKKTEQTLQAYIDVCKAAGQKPLPVDHPIRAWCADAGITEEMLQVAWCVFRDDHLTGKNKDKRQKDWPAHFANSVRRRWYELWYTGDQGVAWTSNGLQERKVLEERQRQKEGTHAA